MKRLASILFIALLLLPVVQTFRPFVTERPLIGAEIAADVPPPTINRWLSGEFQKQVESWFGLHAGFRGSLVRTWNQLHVSLTGQMPPRAEPGTRVIIGRNHQLFEASYIASANEPDPYSDALAQQAIRDLKRLQDRLAARGIPLLLVIAPSKAEILREDVPAELLRPPESRKPSGYERSEPLLRASGVLFVDGHRMFAEWKQRGEKNLFPLGGTHWSYASAARVVEHVYELLNRKSNGKVPRIELVRTDPVRTEGTDSDLANLLNAWRNPWLKTIEQRPSLSLADTNAAPADVLYIGDSFMLTFGQLLTTYGKFAAWEGWSYNHSRVKLPAGRITVMDKAARDLAADIASRDAIIIVQRENLLPAIGFDFVTEAHAALDKL